MLTKGYAIFRGPNFQLTSKAPIDQVFESIAEAKVYLNALQREHPELNPDLRKIELVNEVWEWRDFTPSEIDELNSPPH